MPRTTTLFSSALPPRTLLSCDLPGTQEFIFQRVDSGPRKGDLGVLNAHPQPGEPQMFLASPSNQPTTEDYAVIALVPGIDPARSVLILAGTTTFGTQAAAEYVCRQDSLAELLRRLGVSKAADMKPFEALAARESDARRSGDHRSGGRTKASELASRYALRVCRIITTLVTNY